MSEKVLSKSTTPDTTLPEQPAGTVLPVPPSSQLDEILERAQDHLQLQMLLIEVASCNEQADFELITRAYHFAHRYHTGQIRKSGHPFLQHCVEVARILAQLRLDATTVATGLLHDVLEDTPATLDEVVEEFGPKIAALIDGVTKIDRFTFESREARQVETYRKMLLSMVEDIRIILIKLADRLHNMRTLEHVEPVSQKRIAHETIEIYAPLAHRFGLARTRWELEDLSLKYLAQDIYREIRDKIAMKRREREAYIEEFNAPIEEELRKNEILAEITSRAKNFYSIYKKMQARNKPFEEVYDLMAVRIIMNTVGECYHALGLVHTIYRPIPNRIKDYIATPKTNMYQSLHTSVIGPRGLPVEIQLRTKEMHNTAEIGIAAHWRYKSDYTAPSDLDRHITWLRQVLDWQRDATDPAEFMENLKIDLFQDEIFVFTPKGDLHQLPKGATPIDFAFAVHTDIGLHCLTAKINAQIVPLSTELKSGDTVRIITSPHQKPNKSWLQLIKSGKARHSIRRWLKEEQYAHSMHLGHEMLERELKRYRNVPQAKSLDIVAQALGFADNERLYAAIGSGDLSVNKVVNKLFPNKPRPRTKPKLHDKRGIRIQGMNDLMINFAKCCTPIPGDTIIGLITRGRGVSVHRVDCPNISEITEDPDRLLAVDWDLQGERSFTVQLLIKSQDRKYLLSDITKVISDAGIDIRGSSTRTVAHIAEESFWVDVQNIQQLQTIIEKVYRVSGVTEVTRVDEPGTPILE
jgi:guanosine-3',5'-bis(diphosphate) 3'-pyrophosphohydrolase